MMILSFDINVQYDGRFVCSWK